MFDSVLNKGQTAGSRFGTGTVISIVLHAAVFGLVIFLTTRPPPEKEVVSEVKFFAAPPPPPPPPPPPGGSTKPKEVKKKPIKKDQIVQPKEVPKEKPKEAEPEKESEKEAVEGGVAGGVVGGVVGGTGNQLETVPFGEGMSRPVVDMGEIVRTGYTREAREARIHGMMIVKCKVLADGTVKDCRVIKGLQFITENVVQQLTQMKAKPATFQGQPIGIDYVFNFNFVLPN